MVFRRGDQELRVKVAEQTRKVMSSRMKPIPHMSEAALRKFEHLRGPKMAFVGTGLLSIGIGGAGGFSKFWRDGPQGLVEDRIGQVVERAVLMLQQQAQEREDFAARAELRLKDEETRWHAEKVRADEELRVRQRAEWAEHYVKSRRVARECREAAQEILALYERFSVDVMPGESVHLDVEALLAHAERVDPTTQLSRALRENAARTNPRHCAPGTAAGETTSASFSWSRPRQ